MGRARDKVPSSLFDLDGTEQTEEIGQHESMSKFGLVVNVVDLAAVLGECGKGDDVVEVDVEGGIDVVDQGFYVLS